MRKTYETLKDSQQQSRGQGSTTVQYIGRNINISTQILTMDNSRNDASGIDSHSNFEEELSVRKNRTAEKADEGSKASDEKSMYQSLSAEKFKPSNRTFTRL